MTTPSPDHVLRPNDVCLILSIAHSTLYQWIKMGRFPPQRELGPRSVGWPASEVYEWLASRPKV